MNRLLKDKTPIILIKNHSYIQDPSGGRGQRCIHCGNYGETDLGWSSYTSDEMCKEREIKDPYLGLSEKEYSYFINWCNYKFNIFTGKFNKLYSKECFTLKQLKTIFKNKFKNNE